MMFDDPIILFPTTAEKGWVWHGVLPRAPTGSEGPFEPQIEKQGVVVHPGHVTGFMRDNSR